jgi:hypothetical protein
LDKVRKPLLFQLSLSLSLSLFLLALGYGVDSEYNEVMLDVFEAATMGAQGRRMRRGKMRRKKKKKSLEGGHSLEAV